MPPLPLAIWFGVGLVAALPASAPAVFTDVSQSAGLWMNDVTYGLGWGDLDLDGDLDLLICRHWLRPVVYRNLGDGTFTNAFIPPLFDAQDHHSPLLADFDADGDLDIYFTGGADAGVSTVPKKLYRNDGEFSFTDVALQTGVSDSLARGRSCSAMDVDSDGWIDFFVAKAPRELSPNALFHGDGGGQFTDIAASAGLADAFGSVGGVWGDYDRDGDPDLFVSGEEEYTYESRLYRNDGGLTFTDVSAELLPGLGQASGAAWGDYDKDGDLDLAVGLGDQGLYDCVTWDAKTLDFFFHVRSDDDGVDGLDFRQTADSTTFDLYQNGIYHADYVFIGESGDHPGFVSPFSLFFPDCFGMLDFTPGVSLGTYIGTFTSPQTWKIRCPAPVSEGHNFGGTLTTRGEFRDCSPTNLEPYEHGPRGTRLFRNDGALFTDVTAAVAIADTINVRHVLWVDHDFDGWLDLFVLNKGNSCFANRPNILYRNAGGVFEDVTSAVNLAGPEKGLADAASFADYDNDGDLDLAILSGAGPRFFALKEIHRLCRNDGPVGNHLQVELVGVASTPPGYGAWVTCVSAHAGRQHHYVTGNSWRGSQESCTPTFGLGPDAVVDTLRVVWPSGLVNLSTGVAAGTVTVTEDTTWVGAPSLVAAAPLTLRATPNPASGGVTFLIGGRSSAPCRLEVYDAAGRRVLSRSLPREMREPVSWDGRGRGGVRLGAGVYFARVREGEREARTKVVLLGRR